MDESVNNDKVEIKSTFMDDAIQCFARNLFQEQEEQMGRAEPDGNYLIDPQRACQESEACEGATYTKEQIEEIVKNDLQAAGFGDCDRVYTATCKKDRAVDNGCPLLNNLDKLWCKIGEVFTEYQTVDPDRLTSLISQKCPKCDIKWAAAGNLQVNGAITSISHKDVQEVFKALSKLVSDKAANQIIASILAKKIKKLF